MSFFNFLKNIFAGSKDDFSTPCSVIKFHRNEGVFYILALFSLFDSEDFPLGSENEVKASEIRTQIINDLQNKKKDWKLEEEQIQDFIFKFALHTMSTDKYNSLTLSEIIPNALQKQIINNGERFY